MLQTINATLLVDGWMVARMGRPGMPDRLTAELHDRGHRWNRKAVARLMRLAGIEGAHLRRRDKARR